MDVFLVPAGADQYQLYTEEADEVPDDPPVRPPPTGGFFSRTKYRAVGLFEKLKHRFQLVLAEAERERRRDIAARAQDGWFARTKGVSCGGLPRVWRNSGCCGTFAARIRRRSSFRTTFTAADAVAILRDQLSKDFAKHRFWLAIDSLLMVGSAALIVVPGPNAVGYYFAFRVVGHFFSVRGARRALDVVQWTNVPSAPLTELRRAIDLEPVQRLEYAERVASSLRLDHLPSFFQRIVLRST